MITPASSKTGEKTWAELDALLLIVKFSNEENRYSS